MISTTYAGPTPYDSDIQFSFSMAEKVEADSAGRRPRFYPIRYGYSFAMSKVTAILEADADGTLHLPLPPELLNTKVRVTATLEAATPAQERGTPLEALKELRKLGRGRGGTRFSLRLNLGREQ